MQVKSFLSNAATVVGCFGVFAGIMAICFAVSTISPNACDPYFDDENCEVIKN